MIHAPIDHWPQAEREVYETEPLYDLWSRMLAPFDRLEDAVDAELQKLAAKPIAAWWHPVLSGS